MVVRARVIMLRANRHCCNYDARSCPHGEYCDCNLKKSMPDVKAVIIFSMSPTIMPISIIHHSQHHAAQDTSTFANVTVAGDLVINS